MNKINTYTLVVSIFILLSSPFAFSEEEDAAYIKVLNYTNYTVAIDNVESANLLEWGNLRGRRVWDLGPYEPNSTHEDPLQEFGVNYIVGINGQTEGHVIIIKDGQRSDYGQGEIRMVDPKDGESHGAIINFDNKTFYVSIYDEIIPWRDTATIGEEGEDAATVDLGNEGYPLFTVKIEQKPKP